MNFLNLVSCLALGVTLVTAASRYIAIPLDEIDVIEVNPLTTHSSRFPRHTNSYIPALVRHEELDDPGPRIARADSHVLDYVDFGAHTGNNGAYSWYADFPAHR